MVLASESSPFVNPFSAERSLSLAVVGVEATAGVLACQLEVYVVVTTDSILVITMKEVCYVCPCSKSPSTDRHPHGCLLWVLQLEGHHCITIIVVGFIVGFV
jgi:Trk-type K+ transport system membrane component